MTQNENPLFDMAGRLFGDLCHPKDLAEAEAGRWPDAAWSAVEAAGLPGALIPESAGGFGASPVEAFSVLRAAGEHALPLPLGETMLAGLLLAKAAIAIPAGPLGAAGARVADFRPAPSACPRPIRRRSSSHEAAADGPSRAASSR